LVQVRLFPVQAGLFSVQVRLFPGSEFWNPACFQEFAGFVPEKQWTRAGFGARSGFRMPLRGRVCDGVDIRISKIAADPDLRAEADRRTGFPA
jgi:hypothetical protein